MAESERLEELYKYFRSAQDEVDIDIDSCTGTLPGSPQLSHDPVLNALAQLGVCRLDCERAFVSLIDNRNQYVVAEVTKSVSLYKGDHHPDDEGLCMGVRALDLVSGVCAGTMPCFIVPDGRHDISTSNITANSQGFVINDFTLEPQFAEKPYVLAFPFMRFYAGVPIRSSSGHVIGAYAVMDNQPRKKGLDDRGLFVLNEIATSMMRHLELLKIQTSHDSALSLLGSLKSFVQGSDISADTPAAKPDLEKISSSDETEYSDGRESHDSNRENRIAAENESSKGSHDDTESRKVHLKLEPTRQRSKTPRARNGVKAPSKNVINGAVASSAQQHSSPRGSTPATASGQYGSLLTRAADSILAAMRMDEVFFVDAPSLTAQNAVGSISAKAGASVADQPRRSSSARQVETAGSHAAGRDHMSQSPPSSSGPHSITIEAIQPRANGEHCISQALHAELLSQYPRGSFFNFMTKWAEEVSAFDSNGDYDEANGTTLESADLVDEKNSRNLGTSLNDALQSAFPSAQSMMFLPLFGAENGDCPFSIVAWSSEERRILQQEDFAYLGLFGVAIQAEFARITSAIQNRAKSDFISSISHEVRSPLHGILGNAELLLDAEIEQEQRQMAEMIEKCGRSLLSTMEHILTYSKINTSTKEGRSSNHDVRENGSLSTSIDLSALIEDSVDTLIAGNHFRAISASSDGSGESHDRVSSYQRRTSLTDVQQGPLVNLTIEHCSSWHVLTDAPVWARCVMNVLGNALKYTESGTIEVRLGWTAAPANESRDSTKFVRLSISDTGRGISSAYLRSHLYQPFLQENASSTGLGLGLSIVKKLIDGLGGSINIQSVLDEGTLVEITVPVSVQPSGEQRDSADQRHTGRKICCVGETHQRDSAPNVDLPLPSRENSSAAVSSALSLYCRQWFDMDVSYAATSDNVTADLIVLFEQDLDSIQTSNLSDTANATLPQHPRCALLVIPTTSVTSRRPHPSKTPGTFYLAPPFGPRRLAAVLKQALEYTDKINDGTACIPTTITGPLASRTKDDTPTPTPPTRAATNNSIPNPIPSNPPTPTQDPTPSPHPLTATALLVDDNAINLTLLEKCLQRWSMPYKTATNGQEAVDAFQDPANSFAYILLDISMPVMNGIEAARRIRDVEGARARSGRMLRRAKIVAMTGLGDERTRTEALKSGIDVFLTKPIRLRDVKSLLGVT